MKNKSCSLEPLTQTEIQLVEQLRCHPEMMERFQSILALVRNAEGPLKTADEVEEQLIQEVRKLGHATMSEWATQAEARVSTEVKAQDASIRSRKKKR